MHNESQVILADRIVSSCILPELEGIVEYRGRELTEAHLSMICISPIIVAAYDKLDDKSIPTETRVKLSIRLSSLNDKIVKLKAVLKYNGHKPTLIRTVRTHRPNQETISS